MSTDKDTMSPFMQENVLTLLCFSNKNASFLANAVSPADFESTIYKEFAKACIGYVERFGEPPKEHIADLLEHHLQDEKAGPLYSQVLTNIYQSQEAVNEEYVLTQLRQFLRLQRFKAGLMTSVELVQNDRLEEAENAMVNAMRSQIDVFDKGASLLDTDRSLHFLHREDEVIRTGIPHLDRFNLGPSKGAMWMLIAPAKAGKSWGLVHLGKMAAISGKRVLHITLEMPEWQVSQRYIQSILSVSKRKGNFLRTKFVRRKKHDFVSRLDVDEILDRPSFEDHNIAKVIQGKLVKIKHRLPLIIKQFPTGMLTVSGLNAYLDSLARSEGFVPDMLILDYPDLMDYQAGANDQRVALGTLFKKLRGMAIERNLALAVVTQSNREGAGSKVVKDTNVAEDWSKIATADTIITFNRTKAEKDLGLARLWVSNARDDTDKFFVILSQCYDLGQFCLDSALMGDNYWNMLKQHVADDDDMEEEQ